MDGDEKNEKHQQFIFLSSLRMRGLFQFSYSIIIYLMKLNTLLEKLKPKAVSGDISPEVYGIACNSQQVRSGFLFVAIKGYIQNGHDFIPDAISRGAKVVIAESVPQKITGVTSIQVDDSRKALALVSAEFFGDPSRQLKVIGITGTNGKTTTTYLLESIFRQANFNPGVVGTINYRFDDRIIPASTTTPESLEVQKLFAQMVEARVTHVVMEVSSHALDQNRVKGVHFDVALFTNLSSEHLDYHGTIERYAQSKARLFSHFIEESESSGLKFAVLNQDDQQTKYFQSVTTAQIITYGLAGQVDITVENERISAEGISGVLKTPKGDIQFHSSLLGRFNLYNIMGAAGVAYALDIPLEHFCLGLEEVNAVPGRMEKVGQGTDFTILVDYAHTPDALENALSFVRELTSRRVIVVFGCGGGRDKSKRPLMGRIAADLCEVVIITSDNPRNERPEQIIAEIEKGVRETETSKETAATFDIKKGYLTVRDRKKAIRTALNIARKGDVVLIAGKGHEGYQESEGKRVAFDDREKIREALQAARLN